MPVAAVAAPVIAIGFAIATPTVFTVVAAVGATLAAVGTFAKIKELSIAGTILGAIGGVGALASSAGVFGAGGLFGAETVAGAAGEAAGEVAPLAAGAGDVTAAAAPAGGYTMETLANSGLPGSLAGLEPGAGAMPAANVDIIDMVTGAGSENFNALAPAEQIAQAQTISPATEVLPDAAVSAPAPAESVLPDVAQAAAPDVQPPGLVDSQVQGGLDGLPRGVSGDVIAQGGGEGGTLGAQNNPAATPAVTDTTAAPGLIDSPGSAPVTGTTGAEANVSGFAAGGGPQGPAALAARDAAGLLKGADAASPWAKIWDFVEKRPTLMLGALMGASSFLSGAFAPGTTEQQRALYEAQAEQNLAAANLTRTQDELLQRRLRNMGQPIPVARIGTPPGLINSGVTGRPA